MSEGRITKLSDLKEGEGYTIDSKSGVIDIVVIGISPDGIVHCRLSVVQSPDSHDLFDNAQGMSAHLMGWVSDDPFCLPEQYVTRGLPFREDHRLVIYMRNEGVEHQIEFLGPDCVFIADADIPLLAQCSDD